MGFQINFVGDRAVRHIKKFTAGIGKIRRKDACDIYMEELLLVFSALADNKSYRRSVKTEGFSYLVFNISLVGKMKQVFSVAEANEGGRFNGRLRKIIHLKSFALVGGRLYSRRCVAEQFVQSSGGYTSCVLLNCVVDQTEKLVRG